MRTANKIIIVFLSAVLGYAAGAFGGGFLVSVLSSNSHDKSMEAAMTGAFVVGPIFAIIAACFAVWVIRKQ